MASAMPGTEDLLRRELDSRLRSIRFLNSPRTDEFHFTTASKSKRLRALALCHALAVRTDFPVKRPRGLLSPEHLTALVNLLRDTMALTPSEPFNGFRFDAAGADSPTFQRLATQVAERLGLAHDPDNGDCVVTVRPGADGWQVLCRVGNRPLSVRAYRTANYRGSLNATFAAAMVELTQPVPTDRFLNVMSGSGTILLERLRRASLACAWGVDNSTAAHEAARQNAAGIEASGSHGWLHADATALPFAKETFDAVCADLPWGISHGAQAQNADLYRHTFAEVRRVCRQGARFVVLTQDADALCAAQSEIDRCWTLVDERTFVQRGFRPTCATYSAH